MAKIHLTFDQSAQLELLDRAKRMTARAEPLQLDPLEKSVHFLRGVRSRAGMALPAFYLLCGANSVTGENGISMPGYPGLILKEYLKFSSINTITLACRKAFDNATRGLTGNVFAKTSDVTLASVAELWARGTNRSLEDAITALVLLRMVFQDCAQKITDLLNSSAPLGRKIGLLVQHANRSAAHLSMESYEVSILDCAHVVAALVLIGEIVRSFDDPTEHPNYFDELDAASLSAARQLFPGMPDLRLFQNIQIETQARLCWQFGVERGRQMLLEQLPYATGWY